MLAQHRRQLDVKIVQRNDPVDTFSSGQVGRAATDVFVRHPSPDEKELVDSLTWPIRVPQFFLGEQQHPASLPMALTQELVALEVGRYAEQGQRHEASVCDLWAKLEPPGWPPANSSFGRSGTFRDIPPGVSFV